MKKLLFIATLLLAVSANLFAQNDRLPPLIDREVFFGDPEISGAQISPDGKFISFIKPFNGTRNVWVKKAEEPFASARPITNDKLRPVRNYFWSRDGKYVLYVQDKGGDENFNIYAVNPYEKPAAGNEVPENRDLTNTKGVRVFIYNIPKSEPDYMYVGLNDRDKAWHDLYKISISTGEKTLLRENKERITGWIFDWNDRPRLATRSNADGSTDVLRIDEKDMVKVFTASPLENVSLYDFTPDNKKIYMATDVGANRNFSELVLFNPETQKEEFVEKDPASRVDFGSIAFSDRSRKPIYTSYNDEKQKYMWKDKAFESDYNHLKTKLRGKEISFGTSTDDESRILVTAYSDTDAGSTYLFDRKNKKLTLQYVLRPNLPVNDLAEMKPVRYKSSDGLEVPAYLTLPKGVAAKGLPVLIIPHGGPWARDGWGFSSYPQFFANRGYAVLQPNFRGSTGYGKSFLDAGNNEWSQKMQDDITWGVKYLVDNGIADPKRIGILGGSFGGYATLAGVTTTPDLYAAAVSIVGPSNLITLLNSIPPYWEQIRKMFHLRMGDPNTEEGKAQLIRQSPLTHAGRIKTPLLVVQGANDPRVNKAESDQIVIALRERGFPVEYLCAPDEGHGFARPVNSMAMLASAEKFLAKYLNGRYQESMTPEVEQRLQEITVDVKTVALKQ